MPSYNTLTVDELRSMIAYCEWYASRTTSRDRLARNSRKLAQLRVALQGAERVRKTTDDAGRGRPINGATNAFERVPDADRS